MPRPRRHGGGLYKARQKSLDRWVAIKLLAPERVHDERFAEHFEREARTLAKLTHPNIVTVHDHGETDGLFYIMMEFVDGVNLRDLMHEGKMEPAQALAIVPEICASLEFAHGRGVVHRDIKPENILIDRGGRVKIADFGIAALVGSEADSSGTPPYMAPEQEAGASAIDHRADIYALGVVLYEMLTGERPARDLIAPSRKVEIDVRIDELVLRALEKEPERRYQTAGDLRTMVETLRTIPRNTADPETVEPKPADTGKPAFVFRWSLAAAALLVFAAIWVNQTDRTRPAANELTNAGQSGPPTLKADEDQSAYQPLDDAVIGLWESAGDGLPRIEFFADGTMSWDDGSMSVGGNYTIPEKGRMKMEMTSLGSTAVMSIRYAVSGDMLTAINPKGHREEMRRVRMGIADPAALRHGNNSADAIIGNWQKNSDQTRTEFFSDGTMSIHDGGTNFGGNFRLLDDGRVKIDMTVYGTRTISTFHFSVLDDVMTTIDPSGRMDVFTRVPKDDPSDEPADSSETPEGLADLKLTKNQAAKINQWLDEKGGVVDPVEYANYIRSILRDDQLPAFRRISQTGGR